MGLKDIGEGGREGKKLGTQDGFGFAFGKRAEQILMSWIGKLGDGEG